MALPPFIFAVFEQPVLDPAVVRTWQDRVPEGLVFWECPGSHQAEPQYQAYVPLWIATLEAAGIPFAMNPDNSGLTADQIAASPCCVMLLDTDEPDNKTWVTAQNVHDVYPFWEKLSKVGVTFDGGRLIGWQTAQPLWTKDQYILAMSGADYVGADLYAIAGWGAPDKCISGVLEMVANLRADAPGKKVIIWIETGPFNPSWLANLPQVQKEPSDDQFRGMFVACVAAGVAGIGLFPIRDPVTGGFSYDVTTPAVDAQIKLLTRWVYANPWLYQTAGTVLDLGTSSLSAHQWPADGGAVHTLILNTTPGTLTYNVPLANGGKSLRASGTLGAYGVAQYLDDKLVTTLGTVAGTPTTAPTPTPTPTTTPTASGWAEPVIVTDGNGDRFRISATGYQIARV